MPKYRILVVIELAVILLLTVALIFKSKPYVIEGNLTGDIVKTVAHVNLEDNPDLELLYTDSSNDIAYYRVYNKDNFVSVGDTVMTRNGDITKVTSTDIYGFCVESNGLFASGMSGSMIMKEDGTLVGYVSSILNKDTVYCIWR